jgi:predicted kinase
MKVPAVTLTYGVPGSGKTTRARELVEARAKRVSMDELRLMLGAGSRHYNKRTESTVQELVTLSVIKLVADGFDVVVDNCHVTPSLPEKLSQALAGSVKWDVIDCSDVPLETCIARDAARINQGCYALGGPFVGSEAIYSLHGTMLAEQAYGYHLSAEWLMGAFAPRYYVSDRRKPSAFIVGMDGTLAHRGPFSRGCYTKHEFHRDVSLIVQDAAKGEGGAAIIVISDRSEELRRVTEKWLHDQEFAFDLLLMRPVGDTSPASVVKAELFDAHVRKHYNVLGVFDDRDQVVRECWRAMGIRTYQVALGAY